MEEEEGEQSPFAQALVSGDVEALRSAVALFPDRVNGTLAYYTIGMDYDSMPLPETPLECILADWFRDDCHTVLQTTRSSGTSITATTQRAMLDILLACPSLDVNLPRDDFENTGVQCTPLEYVAFARTMFPISRDCNTPWLDDLVDLPKTSDAYAASMISAMLSSRPEARGPNLFAYLLNVGNPADGTQQEDECPHPFPVPYEAIDAALRHGARPRAADVTTARSMELHDVADRMESFRPWGRVRWAVKVRPYALHWIKTHADAVEEERIAKAAAGMVDDPLDDSVAPSSTKRSRCE